MDFPTFGATRTLAASGISATDLKVNSLAEEDPVPGMVRMSKLSLV